MNKGNSGGPSFDTEGNVIGVNTAIFSPSGGSVGIAFDIPADTVKSVITQLKDHGSVTRGWIGVQIQPVTQDIADSLGLKKAEGALVAEPQTDSPAVKAGVEAGDVITAVDGNPVKDARDLAKKIGAMPPKTSVKLTVLHKGAEKTITLTLGEMPAAKEASAANVRKRQCRSFETRPHAGSGQPCSRRRQRRRRGYRRRVLRRCRRPRLFHRRCHPGSRRQIRFDTRRRAQADRRCAHGR